METDLSGFILDRMPTSGSVEDVRVTNRIRILETLRKSGAMPRIKIGELANLSPATVTALTAGLIEEGALQEMKPERQPDGARGRPRTNLAFCPQAAVFIGIRVRENALYFFQSDYSGTFVGTTSKQIATRRLSRDDFGRILVSETRKFIEERGVEMSKVAEISVAVPGTIDRETGELSWSPAFVNAPIPIIKPLIDAFHVRTRISNDANMVARALHFRNPERYKDNFMVLTFGRGVGSGMFMKNELYGGATGMAGEFGHTIHVPGGAACRCGRFGCLEAYLADYGLDRMSMPDGLLRLAEPQGIAQRVGQLEADARAGVKRAQAVFDTAGEALGIAVGRMVAMLSPDLIVLSGSGVKRFDLMQKSFDQSYAANLAAPLRKATEIEILNKTADLVTVGLIESALRRHDRFIAMEG